MLYLEEVSLNRANKEDTYCLHNCCLNKHFFCSIEGLKCLIITHKVVHIIYSSSINCSLKHVHIKIQHIIKVV